MPEKLWAQQSAEIGPGQCSVFGPVRVKRTRETLVKRVLETIDHYQAVHSAKHLSTLDISRPNPEQRVESRATSQRNY